MKIAKPNGIDVQATPEGMLDKYILVPDNYDFDGNNSTDVTDPFSLETFMKVNQLEFGVFKASLTGNVVPNWANLTDDQKKKSVQYFKYPGNFQQSDIDAIFSSDEQKYNWGTLTVASRQNQRLPRLMAAFDYMSFNFTTLQVTMIYLSTKSYCIDYWLADAPHLMLWITNGTYAPLGIDFTNNGMAQIPGFNTGMRDALLNIFVNGNYKYVG
jgi:hypothetical protein